MRNSKYAWADGIPKPPVDPELFGETVERLARDSGEDGVKPQELVAIARDPESPLHGCFEWDDSAAAEKHRQEQARSLIRSLILVRVRVEENRRPARAFYSTKNELGRRHYASHQRVMGDRDLRNQVIVQAWKDLDGYCARFADILSASKARKPLMEAVDALRIEAESIADKAVGVASPRRRRDATDEQRPSA